jgi:hypothetical protein
MKFVPGRAMKASECLAISAFLWCMSSTGLTSPTVSPIIYYDRKKNINLITRAEITLQMQMLHVLCIMLMHHASCMSAAQEKTQLLAGTAKEVQNMSIANSVDIAATCGHVNTHLVSPNLFPCTPAGLRLSTTQRDLN